MPVLFLSVLFNFNFYVYYVLFYACSVLFLFCTCVLLFFSLAFALQCRIH